MQGLAIDTERRDAYHHGNLREALMELLKSRLKTVCLTKVSLRELCRDAGVSQSAFYKHFQSRDELFAALASSTLESVSRRVSERISGETRSVQRVHLLRTCVIDMATQHPSLFALCFLYRPDTGSGELAVARARLRELFDYCDPSRTGWWVVLGEATEIFNGSLRNSN